VLWLAKGERMQLTSWMGDPIQSAASRGIRSRNSLCAVALVGATFAICLIRLCGFVRDNAVDLLFEDQWDFLTPMFKGQGPWACFLYQHGPHRLGLGGLIEWYLYSATGWDVRADAWAAVAVLAAATIAVLALAVRLRGRPSWSDVGFPLLLLGPLHWETMTFTPSLAHSILPLLLTCLLAYAWSSPKPVTQVLAVGAFGTLILFTGYGICGASVTIGLALLLWLRPGKEKPRTDRRQTGLILLLLGGAVMAFAHGYHWDRGTPGWRFPVPNWWDYPRFCALMFTSLLGFRSISVVTTAAGTVLLVLVLAVFFMAAAKIWQREATARTKAVWVLTGTSLVYAALTAVGRLPINIEAAFMWRYMTLMTPAVCGLAIAAEEWSITKPGGPGPCFMIGWVVLAGAIWCNFAPERNAATIAMGKNHWIASYLRTQNLATANKESDFWVYFEAPDSPRIAEKLNWLEQRHLSFFRTSGNNGEEKSPPVSGR
jgi:hypothetical protein